MHGADDQYSLSSTSSLKYLPEEYVRMSLVTQLDGSSKARNAGHKTIQCLGLQKKSKRKVSESFQKRGGALFLNELSVEKRSIPKVEYDLHIPF